MSDHDRIRTDLDRARRLGAITFSVYVSSIAALLDERDALAARLDRIEHAARLVADHRDLALAEDSYRGVNPSVVAALDSLSSAIGDDT